MIRVPVSRTDVLTKTEIHKINNKSKLVKKYGELIDRKSAYEILKKKSLLMKSNCIKRSMMKNLKNNKAHPLKPSLLWENHFKKNKRVQHL